MINTGPAGTVEILNLDNKYIYNIFLMYTSSYKRMYQMITSIKIHNRMLHYLKNILLIPLFHFIIINNLQKIDGNWQVVMVLLEL